MLTTSTLQISLLLAITAGVSGTFEITVDSVTGLAAGQRVEGQGFLLKPCCC